MANEPTTASGGSGNNATVSINDETVKGARPRKRTARTNFSMDVDPGRRSVKGFPATKRELEDLLASGKEANRFYSWSAAFGGFALSGLARIILRGWEPDVWAGFAIAAFCFALVLGYLGYKKKEDGQARLDEIIGQTQHENDD